MVRTRFAPSPTGTPQSIHLGFVIRALWNYAYAKKNGGQFILRIEDTDQKRSRTDTEEAILKTLKKFGIEWDEGPDIGGQLGPYRQSERLDKYKKAAAILVQKGYAYYDFDAVVREKEEIKTAYKSQDKLKELKIRPKARLDNLENSLKRIERGEPHVVRVKIPEDKTFEYYDWILKKKIKFFGKEVPDMILLKSDGFPTYHLAVVIDDIDMNISHVFRGQEWIPSTPIHLFLYEGLDHKVPEIGHFSVILDPRTGKKFSKRDMTALFGVDNWLNQGYLPDAVLNYLMLLGWAPKDNREFFTLEEFVAVFDQSGVQKSNPVFDKDKLDWFNGQYIRKKTNEEIYNLSLEFFKRTDLQSQKKLEKIIPIIKDRITKLSEVNELSDLFFQKPNVDISTLGISAEYQMHLNIAVEYLKNIAWEKDSINNLANVVKEKGIKVGDFFMSLRIAICSSKFTPPLTDVMLILGKEETLNRLNI